MINGCKNLIKNEKYGKYYVAIEKEKNEIIGMMMIHNELSP